MQSTNLCQEFQEGSGFDSSEINRLAMLNLNNFAAANPSSPQRCTMCGSSVKRRSPSSSSLEEPTPKKQQLTLSTPPSSSANATATATTTTTELPPIISQIASTTPDAINLLPILRRCFSDPVNSPGTTNSEAPSSQQQFLNSRSPDNNAKTKVSSTTTPSPAKATATLPPLPRDLRRSVSDPTPSPNGCFLPPTTTTTSSTPPRTWSPSPNSGESPNSKRVKRMKDRLREMIHWWDEVIREGEEEEAPVGGCEEDHNNNNGDGDNSRGNECAAAGAEATTETEEAVSVESSGESLILHFKCPCNKGFQILLSGNNCYYKLM